MQYLRADTNTEVLIGPAVAVGDGFTPVTTLSLSTADEAEIIKYGGATPLTVTSISANGFAAITGADGYYTLDITTGNSDTEGFLTVLINDDSLILPIRVDFMVVNANVYDSLFAAATTDYLQTDAIQFAGTAYATALAAEVDAVWDEPIAGHLTAGTTGLSETLGSAALVDSSVTGTPTSTTFDFTGGSTSANFYADQLVYVLSGTGIGQVRPILSSSYSGGTTTITVDEAWAVTLAASDRFVILVSHLHPKSQISAQVMADLDANGSTVIDELTTQGDTNETKLDTLTTNVATVDTVVDGIQTDLSNGTDGLGAIKTAIDTMDAIADAILVDTGTTIPAQITALNDPSVAEILTTAMTEAYATAGAAPTLAQILFEMRALLAEKSIASTTLTAKKLDGSTTAATYTLDDATSPTSITRTT